MGYDDSDYADSSYAINNPNPIIFGLENYHHYNEYSTGETRYYDIKNRLHRIDGPAIENTLNDSMSSWYIHGRYLKLPSWCPYYKDGKIFRKINKEVIVKVVMTFDREYGLIIDTIYEALEKQKAEKATPNKNAARIIKIK